nr:hypothetical protein Q903MT_gene2045 [Picea sitchensis]
MCNVMNDGILKSAHLFITLSQSPSIIVHQVTMSPAQFTLYLLTLLCKRFQ